MILILPCPLLLPDPLALLIINLLSAVVVMCSSVTVVAVWVENLWFSFSSPVLDSSKVY
jgi:hypothetical protein